MRLEDWDSTPITRYYFDRGIYKFGNYIEHRLEEVGSTTKSEPIARSNRLREFARLMGEDMSTSAIGFRDPSEAPTGKRGRTSGEEEEETILKSGF